MREVTSDSDLAAGDLMCLEHPVSLYLQPPPADQQRVRPLVRLMLHQLTRALMEDLKVDPLGRQKKHKLLLLIDEFPTLGRMEFVSNGMRQMAGYGIKAVIVAQSFMDIQEHYGANQTIVDNCHVLACFAAGRHDDGGPHQPNDRHGDRIPPRLQRRPARRVAQRQLQ